jgi:hypothetical protein
MNKYRRTTRPPAPAWASAPAQPSGWGEDYWGDGGNDNDSWGNNGDWGGVPAPAKFQPPRPCACTYMAPNEMQPKNVGENAQPSESTTEDDAIVERKEHYLIREQIW